MCIGDYAIWDAPSRWGGSRRVRGRILSIDHATVVLECKDVDPWSGHVYKTWNEYAPRGEVTLINTKENK